jgi:hypothetical protein
MQTVLYHAFELFGFCLGIHFFVWRAVPVRNQGFRLALIFSLGGALLLGILVAASGGFRPLDRPAWGLALLLHFSLSAVYMCLYTGLESFSPSIGIAKRVEANMPRGLSRGELAPPWFTEEKLSGARRENLLATGFIRACGGLLQLTPRGRVIARCFWIFRRFLGLPDVGRG